MLSLLRSVNSVNICKENKPYPQMYTTSIEGNQPVAQMLWSQLLHWLNCSLQASSEHFV